MSELQETSDPDPARLDARVVRTRENLRAAALALVAEREWTEISVTDVTKQARVSRPTFYLHYGSLDELAADAVIGRIREATGSVGSQAMSADGVPPSLTAFLREVNAHRVVYRRLIGARSVAGIAREMVAGHLGERLVEWGVVVGPDTEELAQFLAGGVLGFLSYWLRSDAVEPTESVAAAAQRLWSMIHGPLSRDRPR